MRYVHYNPNPEGRSVGDCILRALTKLFGYSWEDAFRETAEYAFMMHDIQISNAVLAAYMRDNGFRQRTLPDNCPLCYTIEQFSIDHPYGEYLVATGSHVVAVVDGFYYDSWDSGQEIPTYYFEKEAAQ